MVKKTIRIYKYHDIDLFYLAENYNFNFPKAIYCSLREYIKKESSVIIFPEKREFPLQIPRKSIRRVLRLDEYKDKDILEFMDKIPQGQVNGVVKNILRAYLCRPVMGTWAQEYNEVFIKGKREIRAAGYEKKSVDKKPKVVIENKVAEPVPRKNSETISDSKVIKEYKKVEVRKSNPVEDIIQESSTDISDDMFLTNAFSSFFD